MLTKEIEIDGKKVKFKASAAVPRIYRLQFGRDLFMDLQRLAESVMKSKKKQEAQKEEGEELQSNIPVNDLSTFEQISYVMAKHADPKNVPGDIMDWLEEFDTFSIYIILPEILKLWNLNSSTQIEAKKNLQKVAGN